MPKLNDQYVLFYCFFLKGNIPLSSSLRNDQNRFIYYLRNERKDRENLILSNPIQENCTRQELHGRSRFSECVEY